MRYCIECSYNGSKYHGWQKQPNASTVEGVLSQCIGLRLSEKIVLTGAGRTDTGVHAFQMFAHFDVDNEIDDDVRFLQQLNSFLPDDILIHSIFKVPPVFHARFSAVERTYQYFISKKKNIFNENMYFFPNTLHVPKMNDACEFLLGEKDFTSFSKANTDTHTNDCNVKKAIWADEGDCLTFTISANRFLRNMVRSIVGTLIDVGQEKLKPENVLDIIKKKDRSEASMSAPANALFLKEIIYPKSII